jgi:hypothetical protein
LGPSLGIIDRFDLFLALGKRKIQLSKFQRVVYEILQDVLQFVAIRADHGKVERKIPPQLDGLS